jgi:hypothetical protein
MKQATLFASFLLLIFTCSCDKPKAIATSKNDQPAVDTMQTPSAVVEDKTKYVISDMQAGPFKIGNELPGPTTLMKYQMRIEQTTRPTDDGIVNEQVTIIGENGIDLLWLKPGVISDQSIPNTITEIMVVSPKYKTSQNIGVGSTIGEFLRAYPAHRIWYTYVSDMYVIESNLLKAQFIIDESDYIGPEIELTSEQIELSSDAFNPDGKIRRIRLIDYSHNL